MSHIEVQPLPMKPVRPQATSAANLPVVDEETASCEVKELYRRFRDDFGRPQVLGILQCFATHPPLLEHMLGLAKEMLFVDGALGRQNKELISTYVSARNQCAYCADSHAYSFRVQGGAQHAVQAALACDLHSDRLTPQQRTLLAFVHTVTESSHMLAPEDVGNMRVAGFSDLQIAEAIHVTALFATFNRVVSAFGLPSQNLLQAFEQEEATGYHSNLHPVDSRQWAASNRAVQIRPRSAQGRLSQICCPILDIRHSVVGPGHGSEVDQPIHEYLPLAYQLQFS